jgi:phage tail sheath gpL-like
MTISFDQVPNDIRLPLTYIEFDNSGAVTGTPAEQYRLLVLGEQAGTAPALTLQQIASRDQARALFGEQGLLTPMLEAALQAGPSLDIWAMPTPPTAGTTAAGSLVLRGSPTQTGVLKLYIGGHQTQVTLNYGLTLRTAAQAVVAALANHPYIAATLLDEDPDNTDQATIKMQPHLVGEAGEQFDIRTTYYPGDAVPAGMSVTVNPLTGGVGDQDILEALASLGEEQFHAVVTPYTDDRNLRTLHEFLLDRWGALKMAEGVAWCAMPGDFSEVTAWGRGKNDHLLTAMAIGDSPTPPWVWAATTAAVGLSALAIDPARPLQSLSLPGVLPPAREVRWSDRERNIILHNGCSTYRVARDGTCLIDRLITTYQTNAYGSDDPSYLDVCTPYTLGYVRRAINLRVQQKYPRHKLASDGTQFGPGQAIVTPSTIKAELIGLMRELELAGIVENVDQFIATLVVERNANDRNRMDILCHPDLVNQFRVFAAKVQFVL